MRLVSVIRLSRETEESTSPERQREQVRKYADLYGHQVVGEAVDLDVGGAISPWDRESLGPWLSDHPSAEWDALCVAKLDRLTRKITDFGTLLEWCQQRDKTIMSVAEGLDFGTAAGRLYAGVLVMFVQFERERGAERRREAAKTMREAGQFGGGQVPWGYRVVHTPTGRVLEPDPGLIETVRTVANMMIDGGTLSGIARWLEANQIATPRGSRKRRTQKGEAGQVYRWWPATVREVLRSRSLLGEMTHNGAVVRDDAGMPVQYEPVLDQETWQLVQHALDRASEPHKGGHKSASYLLQIALCGHIVETGEINETTGQPVVRRCGQPLYQSGAGNGTRYYRCKSRLIGKPCGEPVFRMEELDRSVDWWMETLYGSIPVTRTEVNGDGQRTRERDEVGQQIADLTSERYVKGVVRPDFDEVLARLQARHADLSQLASEPVRRVEVPTGETLGQVFARMDRDGRRRFMLDRQWKFYVRHTAPETPTVEPLVRGLAEWMPPEDLSFVAESSMLREIRQGVGVSGRSRPVG